MPLNLKRFYAYLPKIARYFLLNFPKWMEWHISCHMEFDRSEDQHSGILTLLFWNILYIWKKNPGKKFILVFVHDYFIMDFMFTVSKAHW